MPSVRSVILLAVLLLLFSLVYSILSLLRPPDSGGQGQDSYGTQGYGFRALYEVLHELDIEVSRQFAPPNPQATGETLALIAPDNQLVAVNPTYLQQVLPWVERGGRLVIAQRENSLLSSMPQGKAVADMPTLGECLDLADVRVVPENVGRFPTPSDAEQVRESSEEERERLEESDYAPPNDARQDSAPDNGVGNNTIYDEIFDALNRISVPPREVAIETEGTLAAWRDTLQFVTLPGEGGRTLVFEKSIPAGTIHYQNAAGERCVLAAEFQRGAGSVIFISMPEVLSNRLLAQTHNSILAVRVLSPRGERVLLDEFYHGLGVRGNMLYLLTRPGFAAVALGLLMYVCLSKWRAGVLIGPALPDETRQRRDIGEYLAAMGQFFSRGSLARPFLVRRMYEGVLRELSLDVSLPPETQDEELVSRMLARRDPARAKRVLETLKEVNTALESRSHWTESQTVDAMRRLTGCL